MTADDIISAIGGVPEGKSEQESKFMPKVADNIDVDLTEAAHVSNAATPEELLAALTEKTEGGAK